jgi:hypothetical protein
MSKTTTKTTESKNGAAGKPPRRPRRMAREPKLVDAAEEAAAERVTAEAAQPVLAGQLTTAVDAPAASEPGTAPTSSPPLRRPTKGAQVLALLQRPEGSTLAELVEATGWQQHTVRAALTGLRKKGHEVVRSKRGETTCYTVTAAVTSCSATAAKT